MRVRRRPASWSQGSCTHTRLVGGHKPCACAGAAQYMFYGASAFNQPVEAWDVGQVTHMGVRRRPASGSQGSCTHTRLWGPQAMCVCWRGADYVLLERALSTSPVEAWDVGQVTHMGVRRRPASGSQGSCTHTPLWGPQAMCVCWRGAVYVLLRKLLQPARGSLGRQASSPACGCAAALRQLRRTHGSSAGTHSCSAGGHKPCACAGAAQSMFYGASAFNQPVEAWDVGQVDQHAGAPPPCVMVTGLLHTHELLSGRPQAVCVCWRGAVYVLLPRALSTSPVEAWDVGQVTNMRVRRRPASGSQGSCTHTRLWGPQAMCVCWRGAVYVLWSERFQPACGSLGCRPGHPHGGAPPPCVRVTGLLHTHAALGATSHVRVLARRSLCSPPQALSTSLWKLGTSARSPTWGCAAALRQGHRAPAHVTGLLHTHRAPAHTQLLRGMAATRRECVC